MRRCLVVLGMHRSGTSALTGTLEKLGAWVGETIPASEENPKGYFENRYVGAHNEKILLSINSKWDDLFYEIKTLTSRDLETFTAEAVAILEAQFANRALFAIKDPRLCLIFPIWENALNRLSIQISVIIPFRNPFEVAASLAKRNNFSLEKSFILWAKHLVYAEFFSRKYPRVFIDFQDLIQKPALISELIIQALNLGVDPLQRSHAIEAFIDISLKHHDVGWSVDSRDTPEIVTSLSEMLLHGDFSNYSSFDRIRMGIENSTSLFYCPEIRSFEDRFYQKAAEAESLRSEISQKAAEAESLKQEVYEKELEISRITNSKSWLITAPMRWVLSQIKYLSGALSIKQRVWRIFSKPFVQLACAVILRRVSMTKGHRGVICFFSPLYNHDRMKDGYFVRVKAIDDIFREYLKIHFHTEEYNQNFMTVTIFDEDVISVSYNPFSRSQKLQVILLCLLAGRIYIHSLMQMVNHIVDLPFVKKCVDLHGAVPEEFRLYGDYYNGQLSDDKEAAIAKKADIVVVVTDSMKNHFIAKHSPRKNLHFITIPTLTENGPIQQPCQMARSYFCGKPFIVYAGGTQKWQCIHLIQEVLQKASKLAFYHIYVPEADSFWEAWGDVRRPSNLVVQSLSHDELLQRYHNYHYGFILREDIVVNRVACPTKLIEYLEHGIVPIMHSPYIGDFSRLGLCYVTRSEMLNLMLPDETTRKSMVENNYKIISDLRRMFESGKLELLRSVEK